MRLGFSTNTLADVDPAMVLPTLAELGYESLAITLDRHVLDPFAPDVAAELATHVALFAPSGIVTGPIGEARVRAVLDAYTRASRHRLAVSSVDASSNSQEAPR